MLGCIRDFPKFIRGFVEDLKRIRVLTLTGEKL
jgi:hypothetical protein